MDANPAKRRKVDQTGAYSSGSNGPPLNIAAIGGTSRPSTFALQAQELLQELRIDYDKSFPGADETLRRIKAAIEAIQPQGPTPVSSLPWSSRLSGSASRSRMLIRVSY